MKKTLLLTLFLFTAFLSKGLSLLTESFDNTTFPPTGWTRTASGTLTWARLTAGVFPSQSPHSGAGEANFNSFYVSSGTAELVTPSISFVGGNGITVSFWMYRDNGYATTGDKVDVYVNTSASSSGGTLLGTVNRAIGLSPSVSSNGWYLYSFTVPSTFTTSSNYIIFKGTSLFGNDIFIDDVSVDNPVCGGTPLIPVVTSAPILPSAPLCGGSTTITATDPNQPVTGITYQWQSSSSASGPWANVVGGSGATTLSYTTPALSATTYFRIGATCVNSGLTSYSAPFTALTGAPQPGVISGRPTSCPGDTANYSVPAVSGTTYTWTLPSGWSFMTGTPVNTNIAYVVMGATGGTISVTATSACGGPSVARTKSVFQGSAPGAPTVINGANSVCSSTSQTYSVASVVGATYYVWTLPNGWTGTSTGPSITAFTDTTSGLVTVKAGNGCGFSSITTLAVNVINSLPTPVITSSAVGGVYCTGVLYNFSVAPVAGATSYQWVLPGSWTGTTTGSNIQAFAGTSSGPVKVTAYVSCATSATTTLNATVTPTVNPQVLVSAASAALCQGVPATFTATPTNGGTAPTYQWKKNGANVFSVGASYTDASLVTGDVIAVVMTSNATCRSTDTIRSNSIVTSITPTVTPGISINTTPLVIICAGTTLNFTTTIASGGTAPAYQWYRNNNPIGTGGTGATYSSSSLTNGDTITVQLTTNAACATVSKIFSNKVGIKVNDVVSPTITVSPASVSAGSGPVTFTAAQSGGGPNPQYQWIKNGVDIPGATGDTYTASSLVGGDHITVRMQSYDPCATPGVVTATEVIVSGTTSVAGVSAWNGAVSLYPNPTANGHFTIAATWNGNHSASERVRMDVMSVLGQNVYHSEVVPGNTAKGQWHYDVQLPEGLPAGQYLLRLSVAETGMRAALPFVLTR